MNSARAAECVRAVYAESFASKSCGFRAHRVTDCTTEEATNRHFEKYEWNTTTIHAGVFRCSVRLTERSNGHAAGSRGLRDTLGALRSMLLFHLLGFLQKSKPVRRGCLLFVSGYAALMSAPVALLCFALCRVALLCFSLVCFALLCYALQCCALLCIALICFCAQQLKMPL